MYMSYRSPFVKYYELTLIYYPALMSHNSSDRSPNGLERVIPEVHFRDHEVLAVGRGRAARRTPPGLSRVCATPTSYVLLPSRVDVTSEQWELHLL